MGLSTVGGDSSSGQTMGLSTVGGGQQLRPNNGSEYSWGGDSSSGQTMGLTVGGDSSSGQTMGLSIVGGDSSSGQTMGLSTVGGGQQLRPNNGSEYSWGGTAAQAKQWVWACAPPPLLRVGGGKDMFVPPHFQTQNLGLGIDP